MARLALADLAASAVAYWQQSSEMNPAGQEQFERRAAACNRPYLAAWLSGEISGRGEQIKIGQRVGLLFVAAVSDKIVRTSNARLSTGPRVCLSVLVVVVVAVRPRARPWGVAAVEAES